MTNENKFQWNLNQNTINLNEENEFEDVCKMTAILYQMSWINNFNLFILADFQVNVLVSLQSLREGQAELLTLMRTLVAALRPQVERENDILPQPLVSEEELGRISSKITDDPTFGKRLVCTFELYPILDLELLLSLHSVYCIKIDVI